jgi:hypothetical protein
MPKKHRIALTIQERTELSEIADGAKGSKERRRRANILLMADESEAGAAMTDEAVAKAVRCRSNTVARIRKICYQQGVEAALERTPSSRVQEPKLDGRGEAKLIEIACSRAPEGHARWSLRMLADRLVELEVVDEISHTTVAETLKKTKSNRTS